MLGELTDEAKAFRVRKLETIEEQRAGWPSPERPGRGSLHSAAPIPDDDPLPSLSDEGPAQSERMKQGHRKMPTKKRCSSKWTQERKARSIKRRKKRILVVIQRNNQNRQRNDREVDQRNWRCRQVGRAQQFFHQGPGGAQKKQGSSARIPSCHMSNSLNMTRKKHGGRHLKQSSKAFGGSTQTWGIHHPTSLDE